MEIPGYVDLQVNGYKGVDFSSPDLTEEDCVYAFRELINAGTIAFLPTIITSAPPTYEKNLNLMARLMEKDEFQGHILGLHVEGPFISKEEGARGAHNPDWISPPDVKFLDKLNQWAHGNIKMLTIAAEVEGSDFLCQYAVNLGITVSLGHQMALDDDLERLVHSGARSLTHLGNALPKMLPRHQNPIWAGLANDELMAMVIADGHHVPPAMLKTIIRTKEVSRVVVVSDAAPIAGLPPGTYNTLGNEVILEPSGRLYNPQTGYMVGSSANMTDCMQYLTNLGWLEDHELQAMGFYNPLKLINVDPELIKP